VHDTRPDAVVVDVSVEVAMFVRLLGIPLIVTALPGNRVDPAHLLVHRVADLIIAAWPGELREPRWLRPYAAKTAYVGGISRFAGRRPPGRPADVRRVLLLGGADGFGMDSNEIIESLAAQPDISVTALGGSAGWTADPWPDIAGADVVITHAGQNSIADVAAAERPAVVIPQPRPFDEQRTTAQVLRRHRLAVVSPRWPAQRDWASLVDRAGRLAPGWQRWRVDGAAGRAADAIESVVRRHDSRATL
jgi:UDP-N-acetylglucosamine:LPS N-acetylglucosamine transferase